MKAITHQFQFRQTTLRTPNANPPFLIPTKPNFQLIKAINLPRQTTSHASRTSHIDRPLVLEHVSRREMASPDEFSLVNSKGYSRIVIVGAVSLGVVLFLMGVDDQKALALGPEGPLMEEFWDNMRRYALYFLTVSTGVLYAVFQPLVELLKNPISAVLVLTIIGGGIFIVSQVVSAMVGLSNFDYEYSY